LMTLLIKEIKIKAFAAQGHKHMTRIGAVVEFWPASHQPRVRLG